MRCSFIELKCFLKFAFAIQVVVDCFKSSFGYSVPCGSYLEATLTLH